ncbi:MAG: hypothetical protein ACK5KR_07585 [Breznakia sp.]
MMKRKKKTKQKKQANWLLRFTGIVLLVPALILGYVVLTSLDAQGEPVKGSRFQDQLDPEITSEEIEKLKTSIAYKEVEDVEINLKSATLRISVNMKDDSNAETTENVMRDIYTNKINVILPIDKYFTNHDEVKMYDVEIHAYNYVPTEENVAESTYLVLTKTASTSDVIIDNLRTAKNEELKNSLLNPTQPETTGEAATEEGN